MHLKVLTPKQSLNKAYLKEKISRTDIELFKDQFSSLLQKINKDADEEHLKSLVGDFLKFTFYKDVAQINPIAKNDMVIHTGKLPSDPIGVILEVKSPTNTPEMLSAGKPNTKALHELVLYYLRERIDNNNNQIKYLVATSIFEWFVVDANEFDKKIFRNSAVKRLYDIKKSDGKDNPWFYAELKKLLDTQADLMFEVTYFDIRQYRNIIENENRHDDKALIALYKILSPAHLLKLPFANDSNTLQPRFYAELLHLVGLYEYKEGSKKLISRKKEGERNAGSLLENTIVQLDSHDKISRVDKPSQYGDTYSERLYNVALELVITWINRILFLKLLEAQLINYHKDKAAYSFLNKEKIKDFDDLDKLFFRVLARRAADRTADVEQLFGKVPYLNSSLFEPTELEHQTLFINGLEDRIKVPVLSATVLKDVNGKTLKGEMEAMDYLFAFLNAYDFSSEGAEDIQEDNKALINASVLGLIFEKINGYKDGSFFTPGFITMYMCRETIRRAVVQKFNDAKGWDCKEYHELHDKISDKKEANDIINTLKICDPAVGSGHFLVSALNEIIAIKSDLRVLTDRGGRSMHYYGVEVVNDELIITDENGDIFQYNPNNTESQRVQEMLFHEKQTIIEGCLFGVDINPNSVKICRLRLWIELLKNAYYKTGGRTRELETLPNIDINIKTGNSLISRHPLDVDIKQALKGTKWNINDYKIAVGAYKNATDKEAKRELVRLIADIKKEFKSVISSKEILELKKLESVYFTQYESNRLFEVQLDKQTKSDIKDRQKKAQQKINNLRKEIEDVKNNKVFENAFEWRFEFPEVLNEEGGFVGFDLIIGNPPYGATFADPEKAYIKNNYQIYQYKYDSYTYFIELGLKILKKDYYITYITPTLWLSLENNYLLRKLLINTYALLNIKIFGENVFEEAVVNTCSFLLKKMSSEKDIMVSYKNTDSFISKGELNNNLIINYRTSSRERNIINKIIGCSISLSEFGDVIQGITAYDKYSGQSNDIIKDRAYHSNFKKDDTFRKWLDGQDVSRYVVSWKDKWLSYGAWLAAPRERKYFEGRRILFREVPGRKKTIQATITEEEYFYGHSISPFKPHLGHEESLEYLLGIINSALMSWYGRLEFANFGKDVFPKLNPSDIKLLPINFDGNYFDKISTKVRKRISCVTEAEEQIIDNEIDRLVYQLYGLTEEEVKIVEDAN